MSKLRILHTADFHLGVGLKGAETNSIVIQRRHLDFITQLKRISSIAIENECDFVVISGDVFHSFRPSGFLLNEFSRFVASLTENNIYVIVIAGNHDQPRTSRTEAYLKALHEVRAPRFYYFKTPGSITLNGFRSNRKVKFVCLPYLPPSVLDSSKYINLIDETLSELVEEKSEEYDYLVVLAHFYVEGAKIGSLPSYLPIYDVRVPKSIFKRDDVNYVALGHIHLFQELSPSIVYPGSIERMNFGEEDEDKGVVLVEEINGDLKPSFKKLPCRPLITLPKSKFGFTERIFDLTGVLNPTRKLIEVLSPLNLPKEAIVRLMVKLPYGKGIAKEELTKLMKEKKVMHWFVELVRVRDEDVISHVRPFRDVKDAFKDYIEHVFIKRQGKAFPKDLVDLIVTEGLRIIEEIEREEAL